MRVLFLSINNIWQPHFETELELMLDHLEKGDDVYVLTCNKSLFSCVSNPEKAKLGCLKCRSRFWNGLKRIGLSKGNVINLKRKVSRNVIDSLPFEFKNIEELKKFELFGIDFGLAVASTLISELRDHRFDTLAYKDKIYKSLKSALLIYESVLDALRHYTPDVFYIFNGRFSETKPAVRISQKLGITFYTHERGGDIDRFSLFKNHFPHSRENMKKEINYLWDNSCLAKDEKLKIGEKWFADRKQGVEQGWFSYVTDQGKKTLPAGFNKLKKNIVFFNSSADEYESFPEWNSLIYNDELDACSKIMESFKHRDDIKFYLRVHPNLKGLNNSQIKDLKKLNSLGYKNLKIIWPEELIDSYALVDACNMVLVFLSTIGVEACFRNKPSIVLGRALYEDLNCCYLPKNHESVVSMIDSDLAPKNKSGALKYSYWAASRGVIFKYFKPEGIFKGKFLGEEIKWQLSFWNRICLKLNSLKKGC